ncbi:RNA polymerase sigma factor [Opitutus terrae]|uniref:RNA polymerase sigma factor n=1 Tax=Opitutus terrae (strain DSM 11246 / JCM 15787 / PB90-1) TaxID=452637 RepID=B1ZTW9_OPITP|nr:RNA polymerase sigma factor [Opitutus terrae]ACB75851.1 RNA polymerase, sigma-24 subunit, ECF subfamily [Opitutus terrae PB90-1]
MTPSDSDLIAGVLARDDRAAFGELVRRHQSMVRNFLRHLTRGDIALADDLAQETFIHAYRQLGRFRGDALFSTWLLGIAHNHWRNARRRQREHVEFSEHHLPAGPAGNASAAVDLRHDLATALRTLSPDEQLAIHLGYEQGLSHTEIATLVDWPLGTVKTHLARSKEKLRHLLAAWNPQA